VEPYLHISTVVHGAVLKHREICVSTRAFSFSIRYTQISPSYPESVVNTETINNPLTSVCESFKLGSFQCKVSYRDAPLTGRCDTLTLKPVQTNVGEGTLKLGDRIILP
jgi:hypothetical protein